MINIKGVFKMEHKENKKTERNKENKNNGNVNSRNNEHIKNKRIRGGNSNR
jgi:hypothetical protein